MMFKFMFMLIFSVIVVIVIIWLSVIVVVVHHRLVIINNAWSFNVYWTCVVVGLWSGTIHGATGMNT